MFYSWSSPQRPSWGQKKVAVIERLRPSPHVPWYFWIGNFFFSGYGFRPHMCGESGIRIRRPEWEMFEYAMNPESSGRLIRIFFYPVTEQCRAQFFTVNTVFKMATSFLGSLKQSKMQISRSLRRMLSCQYSQRRSGCKSESGDVRDTCGWANLIWVRIRVDLEIFESGQNKLLIQNSGYMWTGHLNKSQRMDCQPVVERRLLVEVRLYYRRTPLAKLKGKSVSFHPVLAKCSSKTFGKYWNMCVFPFRCRCKN